jgi:hypothetical protein
MTMTYALLRRRNMPDFYCAVPEDKPTPPFITELAWEFMGESEPQQPRPRGFNEDCGAVCRQLPGLLYLPREIRSGAPPGEWFDLEHDPEKLWIFRDHAEQQQLGRHDRFNLKRLP